jgi:hypothetical protein
MGHPGAALSFPLERTRDKQIHHMHHTFTALIETMGGKPSARKPMERAADEVSIGGEIIPRSRDHQDERTILRAVRSIAGARPSCEETSLLLMLRRFLGNPDKNVTLSIVALAWRTARISGGGDEKRQCLSKISFPGATCCGILGFRRRALAGSGAGLVTIEAAQHVHKEVAQEKKAGSKGEYSPKCLLRTNSNTLRRLFRSHHSG